jgi:tight adherence protein C
MQDDLQNWLMLGSAFVAAAMVAMLLGGFVLRRHRLRARYAAGAVAGEGGAVAGRGAFDRLLSVDDRFVGFDDAGHRSKARLELIRAGFFSPDAAKIFALLRASLTLLLPIVGYVFVLPLLGAVAAGKGPACVLFLLFLGYFGPDAYVQRRRRRLSEEYRNVFPDMLDLLVVCIDAGASINAALDRVGQDIAFQSQALATNLQLLVSEMQSGRSIVEAFESFAKRVDLEEAGSLGTLVKQSAEIGSDMGDALHVYAEEMRDKRLMRAEEKAYALPVKMVVPLGLFIFPVIMIVILTPAALNVAASFRGLMNAAR